jgi:hypothetical protein
MLNTRVGLARDRSRYSPPRGLLLLPLIASSSASSTSFACLSWIWLVRVVLWYIFLKNLFYDFISLVCFPHVEYKSWVSERLVALTATTWHVSSTSHLCLLSLHPSSVSSASLSWIYLCWSGPLIFYFKKRKFFFMILSLSCVLPTC